MLPWPAIWHASHKPTPCCILVVVGGGQAGQSFKSGVAEAHGALGRRVRKAPENLGGRVSKSRVRPIVNVIANVKTLLHDTQGRAESE